MNQPDGKKPKPRSGWLTKPLTFVWDEVVVGEHGYSPEKSCYQLAAEYRHSGRTAEQCARNFVKWQTSKAGLSGLALGLPGFAALPLTIPADFASTSYLQLRMIAVIGLLFGWDPKSDQMKTVAFSCLLGSAAGEATRDAGMAIAARTGPKLVEKIPGAALTRLNKFFGVYRLFIKGGHAGPKAVAKTGSKGVINLSKVVPILGGVVGGGLNAIFTRQMGVLAIRIFKEGPPDGGHPTPEQLPTIEATVLKRIEP